MLLEVKSPLGWDSFLRSSRLSDSEDSDSMLHKAKPSLQVPSGIVYHEIVLYSYIISLNANNCSCWFHNVFSAKLFWVASFYFQKFVLYVIQYVPAILRIYHSLAD